MGALAVFGISNDGLNLAVKLLLLVLIAIWLALVFWTYADARRRGEGQILVAAGRRVRPNAASALPGREGARAPTSPRRTDRRRAMRSGRHAAPGHGAPKTRIARRHQPTRAWKER